jgi:SagB-type dehydrogenase family enzyme
LPACIVMGFVDRTVNRLLDLDAQKEVALAVVTLGQAPASATDPPGPSEPPGLRSAVYSASEADFPSIRAIHAASSLARPEEVSAWRERGDEGLLRGPSVRGSARLRARKGSRWREGSLNVEACIGTRGSARRFRRESIGAEALGTVLWAAARGFIADYRASRHDPLLEFLLVVSAVDGLDPGLYRYQPGRRTVALLDIPPNPRDLAGRLVLDEQRGADAAVLVLLMADLTTILERLGNRGYRAAQLEAGIVAGKLYLAATEAGLGVTGLTFYDDEVSRVLGRHAPGLTPMLAVALGQPG